MTGVHLHKWFYNNVTINKKSETDSFSVSHHMLETGGGCGAVAF